MGGFAIRQVWGAVAVGLALSNTGCGGGAPPVSASSEQATVHGTVRIRGKAASKGTVSFNPANSARKSAPTATAEIGPDGTYRVTTLVGGNAITVRTPETVKDRALSYFSEQLDVRRGDNAHDITVPPAGR
jgi:hypothetical protein